MPACHDFSVNQRVFVSGFSSETNYRAFRETQRGGLIGIAIRQNERGLDKYADRLSLSLLVNLVNLFLINSLLLASQKTGRVTTGVTVG
jgi:hypothetical protein